MIFYLMPRLARKIQHRHLVQKMTMFERKFISHKTGEFAKNQIVHDNKETAHVDFNKINHEILCSKFIPNVIDEFQQLPADLIAQKRSEKCSNFNYSLCLLNLSGDANIGACIRTAEIFGVNTVYIFGRRKYDLRSSVGANHYVNVIREETIDIIDDQPVINIQKTLDAFRKYNLNPILVEQCGSDIRQFDFKKIQNPCFIMGMESTGIPEEIISIYSNSIITINQVGIMRSLNVTTACGIVLFYYSNIAQR